MRNFTPLTKTVTATIMAGLMLAAASVSAQAASAEMLIDREALSTEAGISITYDRLVDVATSKCGVEKARTLRDKRNSKQCRDALLVRLIDAVSHDGLSQYHEKKSR